MCFADSLALVLLFTVSTAYHAVCLARCGATAVRAGQLADRSMIFVFIAASYGIFTTVLIPDTSAATLITVEAVAGVAYTLFFIGTLDPRLESAGRAGRPRGAGRSRPRQACHVPRCRRAAEAAAALTRSCRRYLGMGMTVLLCACDAAEATPRSGAQPRPRAVPQTPATFWK